jgi:MoaA/NifB/PqqE/SkfB family radical SAM enzyme
MIAGEKNPLCDTCWHSEAITGQSERTMGNVNIQKPDVYKETIDFSNIFHMNIFLGNKCNLACRMCSPWCSSLIAKQIDIIQQLPPTPIVEFNDDTQKRIVEFIDKCKDLKTLHMYGGEPLVNDFHDLICSHLITTGRASKIILNLSTNLQVDLERKNDLYRHFKQVYITVSIDGEGDTYEYIRWPGNWNKMQNNLKILNNTSKEFGISTVVQNLNIDNLSNLVEYLRTIENFKYKNSTYRRVSDVNDIKIIPTWVIEREIDRLKALNQPTNHIINGLVNMLEAEVEPSRNLKYEEVANFFKQQKDWDSLRNQNLFETKPHFLELAKQFNIEPW